MNNTPLVRLIKTQQAGIIRSNTIIQSLVSFHADQVDRQAYIENNPEEFLDHLRSTLPEAEWRELFSHMFPHIEPGRFEVENLKVQSYSCLVSLYA